MTKIKVIPDFDLSAGYRAMLNALVAMRAVMVNEQRNNTLVAGMVSQTKKDGTNDMKQDITSEQAARMALTGYPVLGEELGVTIEHPRYVFWVDPNDGTRGFQNGMATSCGIVAQYDKIKNMCVACGVVEWSTGRIWMYTPEMEGTVVFYIEKDGFSFSRRVHVYDGEMNTGTTVFVDNFPRFKLKGSNSLSANELVAIYSELFGKERCQVMHEATNAGHHVFVAQGGDGHNVAGAITTCRGGPWDIAPALLVEKAGGFVRGFRREEGSNRFVEVSPLAFEQQHFTVTAGTQEIAKELTQILTAFQIS